MPTYTALTTLHGEPNARALGEALERVDPHPTGVGVFEVEDGSGVWEVGGYFQGPPDATALALLSAAFSAAEFAVSELPDTDWVAHVRRELKPVEAGRFFVYGGHDADRVPEGRIALLIEAAMAFGTGHHGTTLGCLTALDALNSRPERIADIGCGTAVLAMAAKRMFPEAEVIASDIDAVAVEVSQANLDANGLLGSVVCLEATGFDHPDLLAAAPFDLIFANILKGPLIELAPAMAQAAGPGATVILSGILNTQAEEVAAVYTRSGFNPTKRLEIVEWTTLVLTRNA
ncbi:MAG: 50S ribosomal protein L11 methyltransferase [Pseudomonadota bacterium]